MWLSFPQFRVENLAEPLAEKVESQNYRENGKPGHEGEPGRIEEEILPA